MDLKKKLKTNSPNSPENTKLSEIKEEFKITRMESDPPLAKIIQPKPVVEIDLCLKLDYLIFKIATSAMGDTYAVSYKNKIHRIYRLGDSKKKKSN